ncbi:hypothetical protein HMPREF3203_02216 [Proteus mirabilis]|nr:hypothetical protein HMPREF3203_02216 [Proteus mirabilis]
MLFSRYLAIVAKKLCKQWLSLRSIVVAIRQNQLCYASLNSS